MSFWSIKRSKAANNIRKETKFLEKTWFLITMIGFQKTPKVLDSKKHPKLKLWTPKNTQSVGVQKTPKAEALDSKKYPKLKLWTPKNTQS
jgi:hypothetical protein